MKPDEVQQIDLRNLDVDIFGTQAEPQDEIDFQCEELFSLAPIRFKPKQKSKVNTGIQQIIKKCHIKVPIVHIKDSLYLIGTSRKLCELKGDKIMIRQGGGYEPLDEYLPAKDKYY